MLERISNTLSHVLPAGSSILLGLSGGVDSVVLLHLLHQLSPRYSWRLSALHVHHGISPQADAWAAFCTDLCARHGIPLQVEQVDIAPLRELGIEAAARKLRHAAFDRQRADFVALAHHLDDQVETLLLQLLRGAGVRGASAMPFAKRAAQHAPHLWNSNYLLEPYQSLPPCRGKVRMGVEQWNDSVLTKLPNNDSQVIGYLPLPLPLQGGGAVGLNGKGDVPRCPVLLRPLLDVARSELLDYARQHNLPWVEDESNADDLYPRNFLRHRVLPLLEQRFPAYRETLARSARHFAEASELLDDLARLDAQNPPLRERVGERVDGHDATLEVSRLQSLSQPRAKNLLRYFLLSLGAPMPQAVQLDDMLHQLCGARKDAEVCIEYGGWEVRRYQGRVYVLRALAEFDLSMVLPWHGEAELDWPALNVRLQFTCAQNSGISLAKLQRAPVTLRLRHGGETLRPHPNAATRTLKNLLQEHHVPPWQRDRLPLLYCGEELVCVSGVAIAAGYQAAAEEAGVQFTCSCNSANSRHAIADHTSKA